MTPRDEDLSVYRANWSPEKSAPEIEPGAAYGMIRCVAAKDIPERIRVPWGFWTNLNREILLRLEETPRKEALRIPFASFELARRAYHSINNEAYRRMAVEAIEVRQVENVIYVRRGKNWGKESDPDLAALSK